ncbi:MAG: DsbC family protein [Gammaproteobacteria bacterium]|nr:MAG: DsbC family protein [Gammaproteobacteria bacterium]RKZ67917.1 MAG: DsbC family protein [Gammaproteobacteria bacterium]
MRVVIVLLYMSLLLSAFNTVADEQVEARLIKRMQEVFPGIDISQVNSTPIDNIYEVMMGPDVVYMTEDARFVLKGDLIDIQERRNLSEAVRSQARVDILKNIPQDEYIEFAAKNSKDTIYVFTDVDCGYCRKLHRDVTELNENAITVRYLAYPRGGVRSATYKQMENIWCAEDRPQALTDAKNGRPAKASKCDNPVANQYALGKKMGVRGTPAIFLEDGQALPGYMPPAELLKALDR